MFNFLNIRQNLDLKPEFLKLENVPLNLALKSWILRPESEYVPYDKAQNFWPRNILSKNDGRILAKLLTGF